MEEDDIDDDDQPRVVYADAEREGRMARYAAGVGEGADVSASRGSHGANEGAFAPRGPAPGAAPWASDDDVDGAPPLTLLEEEDERTRSPARGDGRASAAGARSDAIHPQTLSTRDATANARRGGDRGETLNRAPFSPASGSDDEDVVDASPADAKRANRGLLGASSIVQNQSPEDAADREFLEETLGNAAAAARTASAAEASPQKERPLRKAKTKRPKRPAGLVIKKTAPSKSGLASLASLGALARGETATKENGATNENARGTRDRDASARNGRGAARRPAGGADRKAPARRTLAASRAARLELQEEEEEEEEDDDDDIDDDDGGEDDDGDGAAASAAVRFGVAKDAEAAEDAVPCTEGEEVFPEAPTQQKTNAVGGLMSAMARLPPRAPGSAADDAPARLGGAGPSQRGGARGAHRHGSNAPSARLQRIMHRVRARQAQFLDTAGGGPARDAGSASADAAAGSSRKAWGRPLRVTLVGEGGAEAGLCLWECVCEDDDDASFADAAFADADEDLHLERGRSTRDARSEKSDREWLRRGADAPAPGAVLAMDGRAARELSLRGGSRVSVFPPWNEVEVPPSVATGFKRRRVVVGTLVAV